ncbi:ribonuclease E/G [Rhizosaccharibacter radicis]|uniref:Ribonuclease E/G n=1 Tax=Rhizosaccharibacter radicis TaxID=2782605 RepID=A0ABT1VW68_9PROT|nr:ribonuclease E/G [Acetobacteraceae bacterium KSS12]
MATADAPRPAPPPARILAACRPGEIRIALLAGDALQEYSLWRPGSPDGLGDIHRGRVDHVAPTLGGAFVALGGGLQGFLPLPGDASGVGNGDPLLVRVIRSAQNDKGPRLSLLPEAEKGALELRGAPALLRAGPDPLTTLVGAHPEAPVIVDDPAVAARLHPLAGGRVSVAARAYDDELESQAAALAEPEIALPGGMRASIQPTRALVAIDMDMASLGGDRRPAAQAQMAANRRALPALLHQLRLRNLSGAIVLDLAGLSSRKRRALSADIEAALARDPAGPRFLGFTALGLAEIVRPRGRPPLHELLGTSHARALDALEAALGEELAHPGATVRIAAGAAVLAALEADAAARSDFQRRAGRSAVLRLDPGLPTDAWRLDREAGSFPR